MSEDIGRRDEADESSVAREIRRDEDPMVKLASLRALP